MTTLAAARSDVLGQTFRANPSYEFVPFHRFVGGEQDLIEDLSRDPEVCGLLRPRVRATLGVKAATRSLATLFRARRAPGRLPARLTQAESTQSAADEVIRLVLDGILEVERDGEFVTGASADHLIDGADRPGEAADRLQALSYAAIEYGSALEIDSSASLSARMYFYNRIPVTPRWAQRLATRDAILEFLGLAEGSELRRTVDRRWGLGPNDDMQGWLTWNPRAPRSRRSNDAPMHKIYVSPMPGELRDAVAIVIRALSECEATAFKIGADVHGLFRPDKLVVYLGNYTELEEVARHLTRSLDGMTPHGVPFTAQVDRAGVLSRGMDPPRSTRILSWRETESWRLWVTNRLAVYLLTARATKSHATALTAAQYATARLRLDGVDTQQWTPDSIEWGQQPAGVA
jgi:hypothetical protein